MLMFWMTLYLGSSFANMNGDVIRALDALPHQQHDAGVLAGRA